jgi:hypothetical protein
MDTSIAIVVTVSVEHNYYISAVNKMTLKRLFFKWKWLFLQPRQIYETNYGVK